MMGKPKSQGGGANPRRPRSGRGRGADALAAAAVIAAGTQAYADPVRYEGPVGGLEWQDGVQLDVTLPAFLQGVVPPTAGSFQHDFEYQPMTYIYGYPYYYPVPGFADSMLAGATNGEVGTSYGYVAPVNSGDLIGSGGLDFNSPARLFYDWIYYQHYDYSMIQPGDRAYIGVRFDPGDGVHYGWINLERQGGYTGYDVRVHAWGWETTPGLPIPAGAVPEPGALALLALGFAAVAGRRRS